MPTWSSSRSALALAFVTVFLAGQSASSEVPRYFPVELGWTWDYAHDVMGTEVNQITGTRLVRGRVTQIQRRQQIGTQYPQVVENYWSVDEEGDVFLHGGQNFTFPIVIAYEPPIRLVDAPLSIGKSWESPFTYCNSLDLDGTCQGPYPYPLVVVFEGNITVPAGTFYTYGVGYDDQPPSISVAGNNFDIFARYRGEASSEGALVAEASDWYCDGVGLVQFDAFKMTGWSPPGTTATDESSWGSIKRLFR